MECNRPEISHLLAALCSALSQQQVADPPLPEQEIPLVTEEPQYLQMEAKVGSQPSNETYLESPNHQPLHKLILWPSQAAPECIPSSPPCL